MPLLCYPSVGTLAKLVYINIFLLSLWIKILSLKVSKQVYIDPFVYLKVMIDPKYLIQIVFKLLSISQGLWLIIDLF